MTKPEGINLDIQPHHVKRGAEQAHANNRRERRVNAALLGKEVIIRHEHRANGGKARKRAVERERNAQAIPIPAEARSATSEPFTGSGEAVCDLARAFGYPTREMAPTPTRVYRNAEMVEPIVPKYLPKKAPTRVRRPPEEVRRETAAGWERCCNVCARWLPEASPHYRWRSTRNHWEPECNACHNRRRKEYYEANGF